MMARIQRVALVAMLCAGLRVQTSAFLRPQAGASLRTRPALYMSISEDPLAGVKPQLNFSVSDIPPNLPIQERKELWMNISRAEAQLARAVNTEQFELAAELREECEALRRKDRYKVLEDLFEQAFVVKDLVTARKLQMLMIAAGAPPTQQMMKRPWGGGPKRLTREDRESPYDDGGAGPPMAGAGGGGYDPERRMQQQQQRQRKPLRSPNRGRSSLPEELRSGIEVSDSSEATTDDVLVEVRSFYSPEQSKPAQNEFMFLYRVRITNQGQHTVRLLQRKWEIESSSGDKETAQGPGVIGTQPFLEPGQSFEYTSAVPIRGRIARKNGDAVVGRMSGAYIMRVEDDGGEEGGEQTGEPFEVRIAPFYLMLADADGENGTA